MLEARIKKWTEKVKKLTLKFYKCMQINARHLGQKLTRFAIAFGTSAHTQLQGQWNINNSCGDSLIFFSLGGGGAKYAPLIEIGLTILPKFGEEHGRFHLYLSELAVSNQFLFPMLVNWNGISNDLMLSVQMSFC